MPFSSLMSRVMFLVFVVGAGAVTAAEKIADTAFVQEYRDPFVLGGKGELNDVRGIALDRNETVWVATGGGLCRVSKGKLVPVGDVGGPAFDVAVDSRGTIWVGTWKGLSRVEGEKLVREAGVEVPVGLVKAVSDRLIVSTPQGLLEKKGGTWEGISGPWSPGGPDVAVVGEDLYVASQIGLFRKRGAEVELLDQSKGMLSRNLHGIAADAQGSVWVGSRAGVDLVRDGAHVKSFTPKDGLATSDVRSVAVGPDGRVWIGTALGMVRYDGKNFSLRHSLRWLPGDEVRDVAFSKDGTAWIATNRGVSAIRQRTMTLAEKADYFLNIVRTRHVRKPGLVDHTRLKTPGEVSTWEDMDTDNDGKYTGIYIAMESFRYAVTKSEDAKRNAMESYRAMEFLQTVTGTPGFVARTVIPAEWKVMADPNHDYTDQEVAEEVLRDPRWRKLVNRWRLSQDKKWLWKGGTSSDETTGHFYAYALYYDLVADEAEKKRVAAHVKRVMDYIIDGKYVFVDIDGHHTRWGVWAPESLNHDPDWSLEKGCNSVEILSYLTVAKHVTGDEKYEREIEKLLKEHHYDKNILEPMSPYSDYFTYIGYDLLSMSYPALLSYEKNPERLALYRESFERWFAPVKKDACPMFTMVYAGHSQGEIPAGAFAETMRDITLDQIEWFIDNSKREDLKLVHRPAEDVVQTDRLLPASERAVYRADSNVYRAWNGNGGQEEGSCVAWLLPYWMGRYYGVIEGPGAKRD